MSVHAVDRNITNLRATMERTKSIRGAKRVLATAETHYSMAILIGWVALQQSFEREIYDLIRIAKANGFDLPNPI